MGLHLQQDNTSREGKNQYIIRFAIMLILLGVFRWVTLGFLRTGHSHDNIDQLFAQAGGVRNEAPTPQTSAFPKIGKRRRMTYESAQHASGAVRRLHAAWTRKICDDVSRFPKTWTFGV